VSLLLASCSTVKTATHHVSNKSTADTFIQKEMTRLDTLRVKMDSVKLNVPIAFFSDSGINYLEKGNGRATVKIERIKDIVYVSAVCDSLQMIIAAKDREIQRLHSASYADTVSETKVVKKKPTFITCLLGVFLVILFGYVLMKFINYLKPIQWLKTILSK
jgi:hypothetical protein